MIEIRNAGADWWTASGAATTWAGIRPAYYVYSPREGMFLEQFERGSCDRAVRGEEDVETRLEHRADGPVFSRTSDGTLRFENGGHALMLVSALSKRDPATRDLVDNVHAGTLTGLSVGFKALADSWGTAPDGRTALRTIHDAKLSEVSFVAKPCNPRAGIESLRYEQRSDPDGIEYRSFPLALAEDRLCPSCGEPVSSENLADGRSSKYTQAEINALGRQGKAFRHPDGTYAFPINDREDLSNAIRAVGGRARKSPAEAVRRFIMHRAREMGLSSMIPATWNAGGASDSAGRSLLAQNDSDDLRLELQVADMKAGRHAKRGAAVLLPNDTNELESELWRMQLKRATA